MSPIEEHTKEIEPVHEMKRRWPNQLNKEKQFIKFSQTSNAAVVEIIFKKAGDKIVAEETNLDFISWEDLENLILKPDADVVDNAKEFVESDGYSLINTIDRRKPLVGIRYFIYQR